MSSLHRNRSPRAKGKPPRGPATTRGEASSSRSAAGQGLFARHVLPDDESRQAFRELHQQYVARFAPSGIAEQALLNQMVAARWRLSRLRALETQVFEESLDSAMNPLASGPKLALIHRYETILQGVYERALRIFLKLRTPDMRNEPTK